MGVRSFFKKVGGGIGDIAKKAAPFATFIPGVGPVAAGLIGAGGAALGTLNDDDPSLGGALGSMAGHGLGGYGGAKALDYGAGKFGGGAAGGLMGAGAGGAAGAGGGGMDWKDWLTLGTGVAGAGASIYGGYQDGKAADADRAESSKRYADATAFRDRSYGDERADLQFGRDQNRRSGMALNPMLAGLLGNRGQSTQMESRMPDDDEELRRLQAVQMSSRI